MIKESKSKIILIFAWFTIFSIPMAIGLNFVKNIPYNDEIFEESLSNPFISVPHAKIIITGNSELDAFCPGTDGLSWATAHVIENLEISSTDNCIRISDTDRFLFIRNCTLMDAFPPSRGVFLANCTNVKIINCTIITDSSTGIFLYNSHKNFILENKILYPNGYGIYVADSNHNIVANNSVIFNQQGLEIENSINTTVSSNNFSNNEFYGIHITDSSSQNRIFNNTISNNNAYGIYFSPTTQNNEIYDNVFCNNKNGDYLDNGQNNNIHDNKGCPTTPTGDGAIPGYHLLWILAISFCFFLTLLYKQLKNLKK